MLYSKKKHLKYCKVKSFKLVKYLMKPCATCFISIFFGLPLETSFEGYQKKNSIT